MSAPSPCDIKTKKGTFCTYDYIGTPYFIYESKSGYPAVYCSDKCRRKHNHRFNQNKTEVKKWKRKFEEITSYIPKLANKINDYEIEMLKG